MPNNIPNILDATTCLLVRFHKTGLMRKGDINKVKTEADKTKLRLAKQILESEAYDNLRLIARDLRRYIKKRELPSPFAQGTHLVPVDLVQEINKKIQEAETAYGVQADLFVEEYPTLRDKAAKDLEDQFDDKNYFDNMIRLRNRFYLERRWFDFSPSSPDKVGPAIATAEAANRANEAADLYNKVKAALRVALRDLIGHLAERLTPGADGKKKQFAPTTITNITEWLDIFSKRNVCKDESLADLAGKAEKILKGVTVDSLKEDADIAATVRAQMDEINTALTGLVEEMDDRALALDDEED